MRVAQKPVYYCDHCHKHGLSRVAMERHERKCTLNPTRACRWGGEHSLNFTYLAGALQDRAPLEQASIGWLRDEVDGCPPCMLAALRQSGVEYHYDADSRNIFDYKAEVDRARAEEREQIQQEEYYGAVQW